MTLSLLGLNGMGVTMGLYIVLQKLRVMLQPVTQLQRLKSYTKLAQYSPGSLSASWSKGRRPVSLTTPVKKRHIRNRDFKSADTVFSALEVVDTIAEASDSPISFFNDTDSASDNDACKANSAATKSESQPEGL
jgi:hypothetical protein